MRLQGAMEPHFCIGKVFGNDVAGAGSFRRVVWLNSALSTSGSRSVGAVRREFGGEVAAKRLHRRPGGRAMPPPSPR
jgi:hypothetical protein